MRLVIAWIVLAACRASDPDPIAPTPPPNTPPTPTPILDAVSTTPSAPPSFTGWCSRPTSTRPPLLANAPARPGRRLEVTADLRSVKPMRKRGFSSYRSSWNRDGAPRWRGRLDPTIVGDTLRLSTWPQSCQDTNMGCSLGYWHSPGEVQLEEKVPADACISYAIRLGSGMAIGIGTEMRTYVQREDSSVIAGPRVTTPVLEAVENVEDHVVLQEHDGGLWLASWNAATPELSRVPGVPGRVLSLSYAGSGPAYIYTTSGLYAVDATTFAPQWHVDGEVWSVLSQDVPVEYTVLTIERGATSKAVLRRLDKSGKQLREIVVYEAPDLIEAHLYSSSYPVRDVEEPIFFVEIVTEP